MASGRARGGVWQLVVSGEAGRGQFLWVDGSQGVKKWKQEGQSEEGKGEERWERRKRESSGSRGKALLIAWKRET